LPWIHEHQSGPVSGITLAPGQSVTIHLGGGNGAPGGIFHSHSHSHSQPRPDHKHPTTLGWRCWEWDIETHQLFSPSQGTLWPTPELHCDHWDEIEVVQGAAGIHASLVPPNWKQNLHPIHPNHQAYIKHREDGSLSPCIVITGIVERFGRYVLGTDGWRAEWVIIRKLRAPTAEIGLALEATFPDVEIVYD